MKLKMLTSSIVFAGLLYCGVIADDFDHKFQLTSQELEWLGEQIYSNECNANFECLTSWNSGRIFLHLASDILFGFAPTNSRPSKKHFLN